MQASKRTFGVEIECGHPIGYTRVVQELRNEGIETYGSTTDGSGVEIKSAVYSGKKGYDDLTRLMEFLNELGCYVTRADGMHVHIGAKELQKSLDARTALARTWYHNQGVIGRMCSNHRTGSYVCRRLDYNELPGLAANMRTNTRLKSLNVHPLVPRGTVEFRLHEGCLDPRKAVAWVQFCQSLVQYSVDTKKEILTCASKTALLSAVGTPEDAISVLSPRQKQLRRLGKTYVKKGAKK